MGLQSKTMPKQASKKKNGKQSKKKRVIDRSYLYKFRKPSRRIGAGGVLRKSAALGRLMRWPKYVQLQRLKIPPALNIFNNACSKDFASKLVRFSKNYSPETRKQKDLRLKAWAKLQADGQAIPSKKVNTLKMGFNHVTNLIEMGRAKLVIIAHDVDPIELVLWMPALCVKKNIPFVIFKSKAILGALVLKKTAACIAICDVNPGDEEDFKQLIRAARSRFNSRYNQMKKQWGRRVLGIKTRHKNDKRKRDRAAEKQRRKDALSGKKSAIKAAKAGK